MRPSYFQVIIEKLPNDGGKIDAKMWGQASDLDDISFQKSLYDKLNEKVWVGYNISRWDVNYIRMLFTSINPLRPMRIFYVLNWVRVVKVVGGSVKKDLEEYAHLFILGKQPHRAEGDTRLCVEVFGKLIDHAFVGLKEFESSVTHKIRPLKDNYYLPIVPQFPKLAPDALAE